MIIFSHEISDFIKREDFKKLIKTISACPVDKRKGDYKINYWGYKISIYLFDIIWDFLSNYKMVIAVDGHIRHISYVDAIGHYHVIIMAFDENPIHDSFTKMDLERRIDVLVNEMLK